MLVDATNAKTAVTGAIRQAAQNTGASFNYLLATAKVESNLNPVAQAPTSSARGLFQFIEQTWLTMLKEAGSALGLGRYSASITQNAAGGYAVPDAAVRTEIMNLRADPVASAALAGAFTQRNSAELTQRIGRSPTEGELYIAHFLGSGGAGKLINLAANRPSENAATHFPAPAAANRSIFYDRQGNARSTSDVYKVIVGRYQTARASVAPVAPEAVADTAGVTAALAMAQPNPYRAAAAAAAERAAVFHGLFRESPRQPRGAVAPVVTALWAGPKPVTSPAAPQRTVSTARGFDDLFRDSKPDVRRLFQG